MIPGGLGEAPATTGADPSVAAFPQVPLGSPGEIYAIARSLQQAATDLEDSERGLRNAAATLMGDWQGDASTAYQAASGGLSGVVGGASATFRECGAALSGYAGALERTQSEMGRLRGQYEGATQRQAMAASTCGGLTRALSAATKPAEIHQLQGDMTRASGQETGAGDEAAAYVRQATQLLDEFHREESRYMQVLTGDRVGPAPGMPIGSPFAPVVIGAGIPGVGFGVPYATGAAPGFMPGALDPYNGVFEVGNPWDSPIPGYGVYMDSITPEAVPTNDLTDAITFIAAPVAGGAVDDILTMGARGLAEQLGFGTAGREAVDAAGQEAEIERFTAGNYRTGDPLNTGKMREVYQAGRTARTDAEIGQEETRGVVRDQILDGLDKTDKLPPGVTDTLSNVLENSQLYGAYAKSYAKSMGAPVLKVVKAALGFLARP
ncbi:MAG TPA: WXG100 family type VII secretion target [Solirubrobacteraceae bacterium]|nr:WXG100 family type VII secretion target [Solirubrobacteraceae bacterium]